MTKQIAPFSCTQRVQGVHTKVEFVHLTPGLLGLGAHTHTHLLPQSSAAAIEKAKSGSTISLTKYLRISSRGGNRSRMTKMLEPVPTPDCGEDTESQDFNTSLEQEQEQEDQQDNSATIPQILGGSRDGRPEMNQNDSVDHEVHFVEWLSAIRDKPTKADQRIAIISRTAQSLGLQSV